MKHFVIVTAMMVLASAIIGCPSSAAVEKQAAEVARQAADPCSLVSWTTVSAGCIVRIKNECAKDDETCAVYVECTNARKKWQACK